MAGLHMGIVRFLAAEKDKSTIRDDFLSVFVFVLGCGAALAVAMSLLAGPLASLVFKNPGSAVYIRLASAIIPATALFTVSIAFFQATRKIGLYTALGLAPALLQLGLVVLLFWLGFSIDAVIFSSLATNSFFILIMLAIVIRRYGFGLPTFKYIGEYIRFSLPLTPNIAIMWIINASDRYMIGYFMSTADAGIYNAAYSLASYASFLITPIGTVIYPTISKLYDEGKAAEAQDYLSHSVRFFLMIAIPAGTGLSVLAAPLLENLTTPEFAAGAVIAPFVAFGAILAAFHPIGEYIILLAKKSGLLVWLLIISAGVNIAGNLLLIPALGLMGAAIATLIAYAVLGLSTLAVSRRYLKFDISLPFIIKSLSASAVMALALYLINPHTVALLATSIVLGVVIYFGALFLLRGFSRAEARFFLGLIARRFAAGGTGAAPPASSFRREEG